MKRNKTLNFIKFALISFIALSFLRITPVQAINIEDPIIFKSQVGIPGFDAATTTMNESSITYIAQMIKAFYDYGLAIGGILAAIVLMAGGLIWLTSAGSSDKITQAKGLIIGSITGLGLLFGAWIILNTINPNLIDLSIADVRIIDKSTFGCCQYTNKAEMETTINCKKRGGNLMESQDPNRFYQLNYTSNKCVQSGCCIHKNGSIVVGCQETISFFCQGTFMPMSCVDATVKLGLDSCQRLEDQCKDADRGNSCKSLDGVSCHCYDGVSWYGGGKIKEPCGNKEEAPRCTNEGYIDMGLVHCNGVHMFWDDLGGRSCDSGLYCCYDQRN